MELTIHGVERIQGRTKMQVRDVMELISSGAVVSLGSDNAYEYLLFYSRPNKSARIAVVALGRKRLISVGQKDYRLPDGIRCVDAQLVQRAHDVSSSFYSRKEKARFRAAQKSRLRVSLFVLEGKRTILRYDCGFMATANASSADATLAFVMPQLQVIVPLVEANKGTAKAPVRYEVWCVHEHSLKMAMHVRVHHETLLKRTAINGSQAATM